ncbi:FCD domain-containing protein [Rhizobium sp. 16-449-1b]|uniref:GntR family transcriptional regulator n=1 Tax=Rhizobium sp. 16-449-1b TaxID=2819989 RepID=UPI001ADC4FCA|nr:FCD domain-containing protein [Rhizobium sp. 16-449-1b]MBO9195919.1 FCD domain-containing protein [Rhizobium sp. 16-449-1b]
MSQKQNHGATIRNTLRERILSCDLVPGERIVISDLCDEFGVSLGAVREALSGLEGEGLVHAHAKRGFQVVGVSLEDMFDLTRARIEIESSCLRLSIAQGDIAWESNVVASLYRISATPREQSNTIDEMSAAWSEAHANFHAALVAGCRNHTLLGVRRTLFNRAERYRRLSMPVDHENRDVALEHEALAKAALNRDAALACELIDAHLSKTALLISEATIRSQHSNDGEPVKPVPSVSI